jgi:hypothetical protein
MSRTRRVRLSFGLRFPAAISTLALYQCLGPQGWTTSISTAAIALHTIDKAYLSQSRESPIRPLYQRSSAPTTSTIPRATWGCRHPGDNASTVSLTQRP